MSNKSGLADSPFFTPVSQANPKPLPQPVAETQAKNVDTPTKKIEKPKAEKVIQRREPDTVIPRHHDTTVSTSEPETVEIVRKAVKEFGKEAATHRFTEAEKKEIASLVFTYLSRGIRTSENEITRISVNYIVQDYKENGENSILHKILEALNK